MREEILKAQEDFYYCRLGNVFPPPPFFSEIQNPNPRSTLSIFFTCHLSFVFFLSTLWMLTLSEIIGHAEWVTVHELSSSTMAGHCRSSYPGTDHFHFRGLLCPDLKKKLNIFRALEVTVFPKAFLPTWNKSVVFNVSWKDFVCLSSLNLYLNL